MSWRLTQLALTENGLPAIQKLVLAVISCNSDSTGVCTLTLAEIMKRTSLSKQAVCSATNALEESGVITKSKVTTRVKYKVNEANLQRSTRMTFKGQRDEPSKVNEDDLPLPKVNEDDLQKEKIPQTPLKEKAKVLLTRENKEKNILKKEEIGVRDPLSEILNKTELEGFTRFWTAFPKKVGGKPAAAKKFKTALRHASADDLVLAVEWCAKHQWAETEMKYIPNPETWLNKGRYVEVIEEMQVKRAEVTTHKRVLSPAMLAALEDVPEEVREQWRRERKNEQ